MYLLKLCRLHETSVRSSETENAVLLRHIWLSLWNLWIQRRLLPAHYMGISKVFKNCYKTGRLQWGGQ